MPRDTNRVALKIAGTSGLIGFANFTTITRYNRSVRYAMAVHDLAQALAAGVYAADK